MATDIDKLRAERERLSKVVQRESSTLEAIVQAGQRLVALRQRLKEKGVSPTERQLLDALGRDIEQFRSRADQIREQRKKDTSALQRIRKAIRRWKRKHAGDTRVMYDSIDPTVMPEGAAACYTAGFWPTCSTVQKSNKWKPVLTVSIRPGASGRCADVEVGDYTNAEGAASKAAVKYESVSNLPALWNAIKAAGKDPNKELFWTAHYDGHEHICDETCGFGVTKEMAARIAGTQWTSTALGRNLDQSLVENRIFG